MNPKGLATTAAHFNALESLGRTDDMLAVIGVIMLLGVILQSFGEYWQGVYAKASYHNQCNNTPTAAQIAENHKKNTTRYIIIVSTVSLAIILTIIYIMRRRMHAHTAVVSEAGVI